ncbi:MAG TPA: FeoA family protein [Longimicrobiaceae bacterium]
MSRSLARLRPGEKGRVTQIDETRPAMKRLMDLGITRGATIEVIRAAPLGDPIEVRLRGFMLTLRRAEAEHITVDG